MPPQFAVKFIRMPKLITSPNIDFRQLRHVVVLARHLSFTLAARELGLTQPALTKSIQAIEERLGARLFDRDRGGVRLTELGRRYARRAADLLVEARELDGMARQSANGVGGEAHFGMAPLPAQALLPALFIREFKESPELISHVAISDPETLVARVASEELEFCVCSQRTSLPSMLRSDDLGTIRISLLVRVDHPLIVDPESNRIEDFPLIVSSQMPDAGLQILGSTKLVPPRVVVDDFGVLTRIARGSDAVWLSSAFAARQELEDGLLTKLPAFDGLLEARISLVMYSHLRRSLSPVAKRFRDWFHAQIISQAPA